MKLYVIRDHNFKIDFALLMVLLNRILNSFFYNKVYLVHASNIAVLARSKGELLTIM